MTLFGTVHMPQLDGATEWLNSEPLDPAGLRGRVVLVNFWTLTCINWLRQEPYVRAWSQAYRDDGVVVIGVHTPEFSFEHELDLVRQATEDREIDYPVALDNDYAIWSAFDNHYWPALYFVDREGVIHYQQFGEGRYAESERVIQDLLGVERELVPVEGLGVEAEADWDHLRTPETYLGYGRGERFASKDGAASDEARAYGLPERLRSNQWALAGEWTIGRENVVLDEAGGSIAFRFDARDAHLVLSQGAHEQVPFRVLVDGEAPGPSHGVDVDEDGNGLLRDGRLYQLVREHDAVRERTLEITFLESGAEAYAFTFG
jgi:thiol-disulfide isomerase/thioredoxin